MRARWATVLERAAVIGLGLVPFVVQPPRLTLEDLLDIFRGR